MPIYEVKRRLWDSEEGLETQTTVINTNIKEEAIAAFEVIHKEIIKIKEKDPELKNKMERFEFGIQGLFYKDGDYQEEVEGHYVDKTFIFFHPEENIINIEGKAISIENRKILSFLGAGVNGFVLKCLDTRLDSNLAIKIWLKDEKALFEARKLRKAEHSNVVNIKYSGIAVGYNYAELDLIDGKTLRKWLQSRPSLQKRTLIAKQLIETLDYLHDQNIYHGDLHEDNIIITPELKIKILDFGTSQISGKSYKEISDVRASWILTHTLYALLNPEIDPFMPFFHDQIQYFKEECKWQRIRKAHNKNPILFPAEYVSSSFDFIIEFLIAKENYTVTGRNVQLLSDLAVFLMRSPFIKSEKLFRYLSENCSEQERKAFISSMYSSTYFDESDDIRNIDDTVYQLMERTQNELEKSDGFSNPVKYYEILSLTFFTNCDDYRAWRKFHKRIMMIRGITSITNTDI